MVALSFLLLNNGYSLSCAVVHSQTRCQFLFIFRRYLNHLSRKIEEKITAAADVELES